MRWWYNNWICLSFAITTLAQTTIPCDTHCCHSDMHTISTQICHQHCHVDSVVEPVHQNPEPNCFAYAVWNEFWCWFPTKHTDSWSRIMFVHTILQTLAMSITRFRIAGSQSTISTNDAPSSRIWGNYSYKSWHNSVSVSDISQIYILLMM